MSITSGHKCNTFMTRLYKYITLFIFFILPSRVAKIFVSLSILALIYNVKNVDVVKKHYNEEKLNSLLNISFNKEIMILPSYTVHWFWPDQLLQKSIRLDDSDMTLRDIICNDELLHKHLRYITDILLENIPKTLKIKLNLKEAKDRLIVKHNVMNLLIYG